MGGVSGASGPGSIDASRAAPHATAHRRCSAAMTRDGPRPAPHVRVCRIVWGGWNPDPSRADGRDRRADGRDDRDALQGCLGGAGGPHARTCAAPRPGTRANSTRVRDRRRGRSQTAEHRPGRCAHEGPTPRGRSVERAPSTIHGNIMQNDRRLIRPAAASSRSRGPGGCYSRSSRSASHTLSHASSAQVASHGIVLARHHGRRLGRSFMGVDQA